MYIVNGNAKGMKPEWAGMNGHVWTIHDNHDIRDTNLNQTHTTGYQYLLLSNGEIHRRRGYNIGYYGGGATHLATWDDWQNITPKSGDFFTTPEGEGQYSGNLDDIKTSSIKRTKGDQVTGTPQVDNKWGIVQTFMENTTPRTEAGFQLFVSIDGTQRGEIFTRTIAGGRWTQWKSIKDGISQLALIKPENLPKYTGDFNNITTSSIMKAGGERGNRPIDSSEGIIQTYIGEGNRKTQTWYGLSGPGKEQVYTRVQDQGQWTTWRKTMTDQDIRQQEETFRHHKTRIEDIKIQVHSGYYHTTEATRNLPEEVMNDPLSKNCILLIINKDQKVHYEYTPIQGKYKGHMYIGDFSQTRAVEIQWSKVADTNGHLKVHDTRQTGSTTPEKYYEHTNSHDGGYIVYEWKWASDIGLQEYLGQDNDDILLQTIVPQSKEQVAGVIISQVAYDLDTHQYYFRNARQQSKDGPWNVWSAWTTNAGGGSQIIVKADLKQPLINMFNNWRDTYLKK